MAIIEKGELGEDQKNVETEAIKCSGCGSNMVFDPDTQMLYCEHCGRKESFAKDLSASEQDLLSGFDHDQNWVEENSTVFECGNCGAKVSLDNSETAKICPFCGTAHVQKVEELSGLKPNGVLPFLFDGDKAAEYSKAWARKRIFAPRKFKKSLSAENIKGVYTPCFTFDSKTTSIYEGRIGKRHYRTVGSGKNRRTESYIVWRKIAGTYCENFDDVLITAGNFFDQPKLDKISPFDTNASKEYDKNYMLGFMAYHYDKGLPDCWDNAKTRMDGAIKNSILAQYSYDVVDYLNVSTSHEAVTYKYVLIPVYVGNFTYKKKLYNFYVNGTSGKVNGKTPISPWRVLIAVVLGLIAAAVVGAIVYFSGALN